MKTWTMLYVCAAFGLLMGACASDDVSPSSTTDAALTCSDDECTPGACGWVIVDGGSTCIEKPDCTDLDEGTCSATLGCTAIRGRLATEPAGTQNFAGCGDGTGTAGTAFRCTAAGPEGPCWVISEDRVPSGWQKWPCGDPSTEAECMAQGPYGS